MSMNMDMDMGSMSSSSSGSGGHDHSSMSMGMGMDMDMGACEMMMLGNWKTIGSCFLTSSWRVSTQAQFAGTCIGVFLLVVLVESVRRWGREWDRFIVQKAVMERRRSRLERRNQGALEITATTPFSQIQANGRDEESALDSNNLKNQNGNSVATTTKAKDEVRKALFGKFPTSTNGERRALFRPTTLQQMIRSLVYAVQFAGAYIIMLIAMSFNGYILLSIVLGGLFGHFFSASDTLGMAVAVIEDEEEEREYRFKEKKLLRDAGNGVVDEKSSIGESEFERKAGFASESYGGASGACCG